MPPIVHRFAGSRQRGFSPHYAAPAGVSLCRASPIERRSGGHAAVHPRCGSGRQAAAGGTQTQRTHARKGRWPEQLGTSRHRSPCRQHLACPDQVRRAPRSALGCLGSGRQSAMPDASPVRQRQCSARSTGDTACIAQALIVTTVVSRYASPGRAGSRWQLIALERAGVQATTAQLAQGGARLIVVPVLNHDAPPAQLVPLGSAIAFLGTDFAQFHQYVRPFGQRLRFWLRR